MKALIWIVLLCAPLLVMGQEQPTATPAPVPETDMDMPEGEIAPGSYMYNPEGRRDPFWNLLGGKNLKNKKEHIEGLPGLGVDEIELTGIIHNGSEYKALMVGPDGRPYLVGVGEKVYDGVIISIDRYSVQFKKTLEIALMGQKATVVSKTLNPEDEGVQKDE